MAYLINLAIGPVQSYISQARRTQDLWLGSQMLSYLASVGVQTAAAQPGCVMIYPPLPGKSSRRLGVPNHMLFVCDGTAADAEQAAVATVDAVREAWADVANNTRAFFAGRFGGESDWGPIWERQVNHWLEVYWAAVPYDSGEHKDSVKHANQALAARKLLRTFEPTAEAGHKCSITGVHEALWTGSPYLSDVRAFWEGVGARQQNLALIKEGERLCALSAIKRLAHEPRANNTPLQIEARFPSTSSIACAAFRADVVQQWDVLRDLVVRYLEALESLFGSSEEQRERTLYFFRDGRPNPETYPYIAARVPPDYDRDPALTYFMSLDGDFLYDDDTLIPPAITEYGGRETTESDLRPARNALRALISAAQDKGIRRPHTYLAVLVLDGDRMGEYVGVIADRARHTKLSQALADFARDTARAIVEESFSGRLVYVGGDDVLALLPARHALAAADELRRGFRDFMAENGFGDLHASAGLVFIHHTHNIQDAVQTAQAAIRRAKDRYRRGTGAIGVDLIRRSGEHDTTCAQWDTPAALVRLIDELAGHFAENRISRGLAFDIEDIAANMAAAIVPREARKAEFSRILERRSEGMADKALADLADRMSAFAEGLGVDGQGWHDAARWTRLARFLSQAGKDGDA